MWHPISPKLVSRFSAEACSIHHLRSREYMYLRLRQVIVPLDCHPIVHWHSPPRLCIQPHQITLHPNSQISTACTVQVTISIHLHPCLCLCVLWKSRLRTLLAFAFINKYRIPDFRRRSCACRYTPLMVIFLSRLFCLGSIMPHLEIRILSLLSRVVVNRGIEMKGYPRLIHPPTRMVIPPPVP